MLFFVKEDANSPPISETPLIGREFLIEKYTFIQMKDACY